MKLVLLFFLIAASSAWAETNCYRFHPLDRPEPASSIQLPSEIWCYENLAYPMGATFIYNADSFEVHTEMAMLISADGLITHGSLTAGELSVHSVPASYFNPLSVPLEEPRHLPSVYIDETSIQTSSRSVLKTLMGESIGIENVTVEPMTISKSVPASRLPWRGFWWPWKRQTLSNGSSSPLGKYDRFIESRTGTNPNSVEWENDIHKGDSSWWKGHCNGWAASAILRKQPTQSRKDPQSGIVFSVVDQKGILAETDYCANIAYFGKRYRGNPGDDIKDIYPDLFHKTLTYYVGELGKPFPFDYLPNLEVDNHIVSGYTLNIQKTSPDTFRVTAKLKMHKYDSHRTNTPGTAPTYSRSYTYTLKTNSSGQIIGGQWISRKNPDYMWVPLGIADCSLNNPRVSHQWADVILNMPSIEASNEAAEEGSEEL
jgi:hypothetical protein